MTLFRHMTYETCQLLPFFSAIMAMILCGILLMLDMIHATDSIDNIKIIYEVVVVTVGFFVIFCLSWIMKYCWCQLIGILYTYVFFICLWLCRYTEGRNGIFGDNIMYAHGILFLIGLIYLICVIKVLVRRKS